MHQEPADHSAPAHAAPKPLMALLIVVLFFVVATIWLVIAGGLFKLTSIFASFLFLWYWGTVEKFDFSRWLPSLLGGVLGIALTWQLQTLIGFGLLGLIPGVLVIAASIYFLMIGWARIALNASTMLYLTVMTATPILGKVNLLEVSETTVLGALFFGGVGYVAKRAMAARAQPKSKSAAETSSRLI